MSDPQGFEPLPIEGAIRNPANLHHLMVLRPVKQIVRIYRGDILIAESTDALRLIEIGKTIYDPTFYIPKNDLLVALNLLEKSSHCPLKGQASYYGFEGEEIAWSYTEPLDFADGLANHYAFWPAKTRIEEGA